MSESLPGRIPDADAKQLIAQAGPDLIRHPSDHCHMWIRPSYHCKGGGHGLIFRLDHKTPRGYLVGIYCGLTNAAMNMSYNQAVTLWDASDYVMAYPRHNYVVDGDLTSGPTRANEGFHVTNCFFVYNPTRNWVELRLKGCGQPGYYECLVNYTEPGRPSPYWTSQRVALLPPAARANCRTFYSSERRPITTQSTLKTGKHNQKRKKGAPADDSESTSLPIHQYLAK